jgi:hypothetical protein
MTWKANLARGLRPVLVDVSSNNPHPIDYAAAHAAGVQAAFVKATQGQGYTNPYYAADMAGWLAAGVPALGYHFAGFTDPVAEARHFVSVAGARARVLDSETSTDEAWQQDFLTQLHLPAGEEMDYGSASTLPRGVRALLWPAAYGPTAPGFGDLWQYTDKLAVPGIGGLTDASQWTGSVADFFALFTVPGPPGPAPAPAPPTTSEATMNCLDPESEGTWIVDPVDGHVEAINGAPYLGGLNEPVANRFGWMQVGTIAGITPFQDSPGVWGYQIIVRWHQAQANGSWFSTYDFPRSGKGKGELQPAA